MSAVAVLPGLLTYEAYRALPEDGRRYELIEGELFVFATPSIMHQLTSHELDALFHTAVTQRGVGWVLPTPVEVKFPGNTAVQPDFAIVLREHGHIIGKNRINGAPDLIVELLSPSTQGHDLRTKAALYARFGVPEYWTVDLLARSITVRYLDGDAYRERTEHERVQSRAIPGLTIDVRALFAAVEHPELL